MARKKKQKTRRGAEILVAGPGHNLARDADFMQALHDFQYGTGETSARGFELMKQRVLNPQSKSKK